MSKIGSLMMLLPHLIIIYLLFYNMQSLTGNRQYFGVSINQDYIDKEEFKSLSKEYKKLLNIGFLSIFLICLFFIFILDKASFAFTFFILSAISYNFLVYIRIHNKTKDLKNKLLETCKDCDINISSKSIIDVKFINEKDKIIKKFKYIYLIPIFIIVIISIFTFINYPKISNMVPIHWNFMGIADGFIEKSYINIIFLILAQFALSILLSFISLSSIKSRVRVDPENIEQSRLDNIKYLNKIGYTFLVVIFSINLIIINSLMASIYGPNLNIAVSILTFLVTILSTIYLIFTYVKSPNSKYTSSYSPDDDENYWILGSIYNNPNDPSFMVQKRFGIGWTINIATPLGKIFLVATILLLIWLFFDFINSFFY
ncbi:DUF5808 domain-containing protein [Clostridium sp. CCUG 7971]|uniref:DUF5808 domain-containing protein n=1 Tax=Clostridium sp. CCUG 7971 TaxID=2811414 RepID=UPI001ABB1B60|nr:DUF5808 domain-containing protein [Clostridium sp. CCUG 7971]MBO3442954.1 DUF1648 domain-containing protein [Clostridium sp. CCUG 7971]